MHDTETSAVDSRAEITDFCSNYLETHTEALKVDLQGGQRGIDVAAGYARMYDGLFQHLCADALKEMEQDEMPVVAVVAMGGYGRALVAPHSDVDVLFLCDDVEDSAVGEFAERVLYPLWNVGVDVGHAVRSVKATLELSRTDIRTATTLLDLRHIAGDIPLVERLVSQARSEVFELSLDAFLSALVADTVGRHERYGGTLYLREPELKWGRGGLRDLDVIGWIGRARWSVTDLEDLVALGALSEREWIELRAARDHLWAVRNHLHADARRRQDRLTFEEQEVVADKLAYGGGSTLAVEQFMQVHYQHARTVARLVDVMAERAQRLRRPAPTTMRDLGDGLMVHDRHVVMNDSMLHIDPTVALRLFLASLREGVPPEPRSRDAVAEASNDRDWAQALRKSEGAGQLFARLLTDARRAPMRGASTMEALAELGVLFAMIPEFEPIMGRVPHDAYYAYTADVQAIKAVDKLRELERGELASLYPIVSRCAAEMPRPVPLYVALILHSIGAWHPDEPAIHAAAVAGPIAQRLGLSAMAVEHVQWLIANQESFYHWAMRRDITDAETIAEVAGSASTVYRLRDLYLLTFCNVCTANPKAMTAWKARMLKDLWVAALDHIEGRDDRALQLSKLETDALDGIDSAEQGAVRAFVEEMPDRYLLANTAEGVRFHSGVALQAGEGVAISALPSGVGAGALELVVVSDDRAGLLADLSAALACSRFVVDSAQLYTRAGSGSARKAVDIFHVTHRSALSPDELKSEFESLKTLMFSVLNGERAALDLIHTRSATPSWARTGPRIKTDIHVDNEASSQYTIVDVYTRDRDVLLYTIAENLRKAGLSIVIAKVNTEGDRAADVFYVAKNGGGKLADKDTLTQLQSSLRRAIHALDKA